MPAAHGGRIAAWCYDRLRRGRLRVADVAHGWTFDVQVWVVPLAGNTTVSRRVPVAVGGPEAAAGRKRPANE